ncbi:MAG: single-stranded DNA-binding protein, partial [Treponema sp.]|nr:single-stranded DNA-binding protein [Treponema sp.]
MNNLNSIILEGNLTRDSELLEATETFKVCKFSIAVNRWYKN